MFYSQLLLSKKGELGIIWLAAHCYKRLKKEQVQHTDISSSVDKILEDEVPKVTHRILAFLLLGVVRIYSKKVEYLFHDSNEILNKLCGLNIGKSKRAGVGVSQTRYHSITLPKRFELDTFDLELQEDQNLMSGNVRSPEQDMLSDGRRKAGGWTSGLLLKEKMAFSKAYPTAHTPPRDVFSSHHTDQDVFVGSSSNMNISLSGLEVLRGATFSLEDRLDPIVLDEDEEEQMRDKLSTEGIRMTNDMESDSFVSLSNNLSNLAPGLEVLRGTTFPLEDCLDPMMLDEVEKEKPNDRPSNDNRSFNFREPVREAEFDSAANPSPLGSESAASLGILNKSGFSFQDSPNFKIMDDAEKGRGHDEPSDKVHEVEEEHVEHLRTRLNFPEVELNDFAGSVDKAQSLDVTKFKNLEVITPESVKFQKPEILPVSVVASDSKLPAAGGTPEVATVQTPATKERGKIVKKKRKSLFDSTATMVANKVFKNWLDDPSDIKRVRRKVPRTRLDVWRARKPMHVHQSFFEPSIPGVSVHAGYLECKTSDARETEQVKLSVGHDGVKSPAVEHVVCEQNGDVRSPSVEHVVREQNGDVRLSREQTPIAPGTPVTRLNSLRSYEAAAVADSDILEPTSSFESVEKRSSSSEAIASDVAFQEETNSYEGDSPGKDACSARTRMVGSYLGKKFLEKEKQKEEQVLNLSQLCAGKTKKDSARLFYEILVLKTRDCIDVEQENAYDDILVRETSKLKLI